MFEKELLILKELLEIDQHVIAKKLGLITYSNIKMSEKLLIESIGCLNELSLKNDDKAKEIFIAIAALIWEHKLVEFDGLKDILVTLLSRIGYAPSSIIVDVNYSFETGEFSPLTSLISQIQATINQMENEVIINNNNYILTDFQKSIWKLLNNKKRVIGISAPTSAGKSFILLLNAVKKLMVENFDIIYIVPTLSLVNQVSEDFIKALKSFNFYNYEILNSYNPDLLDETRKIYVLTQEKAIAAFNFDDPPFNNKSLLIIDEIQNLEHIDEDGDEMRSKILFDAINEFKNLTSVKKIVISGPRIDNIDVIGASLFNDKDCQKKDTNISPVLNITYSIEKTSVNYLFKQYCSLIEKSNNIVITNTTDISEHGKKLYNEKFYKYMTSIIKRLGSGSKNIIFSPTPGQARKTALELTKVFRNESNPELFELSSYLRNSVRSNYSMADMVENAVAYHHGKLPPHVRKVIEKATRIKLIDNLVCTTTLMQGVNLPAQNVIIRNPNLYIRKSENSKELSSYEMANLRGRAGRLLKDFVGRTFVLDENAFSVSEEYDQIELFENTYKELSSGFKEKYEENEYNILQALENNDLSNAKPKSYGHLIVYIRQSILKYGKEAMQKLKGVGIELPINYYNKINRELRKLKVPKLICIRNRYWDPLVLDKIYQDLEMPSVPLSANDKRVSKKLREVLKHLRETPEYKSFFNEHIPERYKKGKGLSLLCNMTQKWLAQHKLIDILSDEYFEDPDKVEDAISTLQNTISFHIPLLLRPIYEIQKQDSTFLSIIETGAYMPLIRKMIEIGIPRETSLYLHERYFTNLKILQNDNIYQMIRERIKEVKNELPYWIKIQIEFIL